MGPWRKRAIRTLAEDVLGPVRRDQIVRDAVRVAAALLAWEYPETVMQFYREGQEHLNNTFHQDSNREIEHKYLTLAALCDELAYRLHAGQHRRRSSGIGMS